MPTDLTPEQWAVVDAHIRAGQDLLAIKAIHVFAGVGVQRAIEIHSERRQGLRADLPERSPTPPTREALLAKLAEVPGLPVAIEAFWDGDSVGWYVILTAIIERSGPSHPRYQEYDLAGFREPGGDMRLFNGQVPPWPEARLAREVGQEIADRLGVPFYFPSPEYPEDQCPRWWERDRGYPCSRCGIPLLQHDRTPWRGMCSECHSVMKREKHTGDGGHAN